jgi:hypothetical protein
MDLSWRMPFDTLNMYEPIAQASISGLRPQGYSRQTRYTLIFSMHQPSHLMSRAFLSSSTFSRRMDSSRLPASGTLYPSFS